MNQQIRYKLTLTVEEDLHSGTGTGDAKVDAVQILNRYGAPVLRATHIKGLLRDVAEQLKTLDNTVTDEQIDQLFGQAESPRQRSALLIASPRLSNNPSSWRLTWTSTARELDNRVPKEDTLRNQEYVGAGEVFQGELALKNDDQLSSLLERCIKRMTHIGSQRSRDAGRVCVQFDKLIDVKKCSTLAKPAVKQSHLRLLLRNLDPIVLPLTGYPGNLLRSACYIRGQQLLGAFFNWAITAGQVEAAIPVLEQINSIGNAYPLPTIELKKEADLPIYQWSVQPFPLHIYTPKPTAVEQATGPWWLKSTGTQNDVLGSKNEIDKFKDSSESEEKPKRPGDNEFLFRDNQATDWQRYHPKMQIHLRNRVATKKWDDQLFAEEEIAEDTLFLADFMFSNHEAAQTFRELFLPVLQGQQWLAIGRGGRPLQVEQAQWLSPNKSIRKSVESFTFTLNSDLIARAPNLNFYDRLDPAMLAELADLDNTFSTEGMVWRTFSETLEVRGFNARSGLPRVPVLAIRRGSSIHIAGSKASQLYLRLAQLSALGERQWEGFGRFELDFAPLEAESVPTEKLKARIKTKTQKQTDPQSNHIGQRESLLKKAFELAEKIPEPKSGGEGGPTKTQWQYLRQQVNIASNIAGISRLLEDLEGHAQKRGGQPWKKACLAEIQRIVETDCRQSVEDAQFFINGLVRKRWLKLKNV